MAHHFVHTLESMGNAINSMVNGSFIGKMLVSAGAAITAFLAPIQWLLVICFATTTLDMIFGMRVAKKFKQKIESGKNWSGTLRKILDEFILVMMAHGIEWAILDESGVFVLTGGVTAIITLTEMWSIIENLNTVDPNGPWKIIGKFLKKKGEDYTGIELDFDKDEHNDDTDVASKPLEDRV